MEQLSGADPRWIGPYTVLGRLGAGGMGTVYLGRSAGGRTVAVKAVRPDLARDAAFRDRFRHEVAAARRVSGAFTAPVVDADPDAEVPWMATAFVVGVSLRQTVFARGPLPEDALGRLTAGLAEALVGVHDAGVIHRDLKPANVLLALDGPHVIDFGISRAADGTALTATGAVIGSAAYMSPEQAMGQFLTPASDVFALGSTIAFAARGTNLFGEGAEAAVLFRVVSTEPDLGAIPPGLRALVAACLAKNPAHRPTPRQVVAAVEQAGHPVPSGSWLPAAVAADIVAVRAVMTRLPEPPPAPPAAPAPPEPADTLATVLLGGAGPGPAGADTATGKATSRRRLVLGLAGGTLAVAGVGAAGFGAVIGLAPGKSKSRAGSGGSPSPSSSISRPSGEEVRDANLGWKVNQSAACAQVLSANGVVACVSLQQIWGLDDQGHTKWTVNAADHGVFFAVTGPTPRTIAAVDGGHLYVAGSSSYPSKNAVIAVDLASGQVQWTAVLDQPHVGGVLAFGGVHAGKAYVVGFGDGKDNGQDFSGSDVWALDLVTQQNAWFHGDGKTLLFSALPQTGDSALFASVDQVKAFDAKGNVSWTHPATPATLGAAGRYFLLADGANGAATTMTALDPGTGNTAWTAPAPVQQSVRGGGIATSEDGSVLYSLWLDPDGGYSLGALDSGTGGTRWKVPIPADPKDSGFFGTRLLCADGNLYRMGADSVVWAFDPANGKPRWKYTGMKGTDPLNLAWSAGDGRLCLLNPSVTTVAVLHANGV